MSALQSALASAWLAFLIGPAAAAVVTTHEAGTGVTIFSNVAARPASVVVTGGMHASHGRTSAQLRASNGGASTATTFPRVAAADQLVRDNDRKKILQDELATELQAVQDAAARGEAADVMHRHESNVAALRRELGAAH